MAILAPGCGSLDDAIQKAMTRIDRIANEIAAGRIGFEDVARDVNETLKDLPRELATELRSSFTAVAERATSAAGSEAKCMTDFARQRLASDLRYLWARLRARLLRQPEPPPPPPWPTVCLPEPSSVPIDYWARKQTNIIWGGWDLQARDASGRGVRAALAYADTRRALRALPPGSDARVTFEWKRDSYDIISENSGYRVAADLTKLGPSIDPKYRKLLLLFGDTVLSEVALESVQPPRTGEDTPTLSPLLLRVAPAAGRTLQGADREFDDHGPRVSYSICLEIRENTKIVAVIDYDAIEWSEEAPAGDQTQATGHWEQTVYVAAPGQKVLAILADPCDKGTFTDTSSDDHEIEGVFYKYKINGRGDGSDVEVHTTISGPVGKTLRIQVEG